MFKFLYEAIIHETSCTIRGRAPQNLYALETHVALLVRCISISSTSNSNQHSFTLSYLINSCGFSLEAAVSASKYVNFENPDKADLVVSFFKKNGFSQSQISKIITGHPPVLLSDPHKTLLPKLLFFQSKGFTSSDIATVLCTQPQILKRSLKNHIIPSFDFLTNWLGTVQNSSIAIKRCPAILVTKLDTCVVHNVNLLRENGVPESNIRALLKQNPRVIVSYRLKEILDKVKEIGFNPLKFRFVHAVYAMVGVNKSKWERKVKAYKRWGLSEEEILLAFRTSPHCILASEDKIMRIMDFLVNKMGLEASLIVKRPELVSNSLEKRLIPRASVIEVLLSKGLVVKKNIYFPTMFQSSEKSFLQKFVTPYREKVSDLLKLYKEKLDLSKMTTKQNMYPSRSRMK